ncbi:MAG: ADP-ribosylation factor-like protein [Candidatus Thorarchaeota archaeon]
MSQASEQLKVCILGEEGVGKRTILGCFKGDALSDEILSVEKIVKDFSSKDSALCEVLLWRWPFNDGPRDMESYFNNAKGIILVFDISRGNTFDTISQWAELAESQTFEDVPMVIIANKSDLTPEVERDAILEVALALDAPCFMTNAMTGENVRESIETVLEIICEQHRV